MACAVLAGVTALAASTAIRNDRGSRADTNVAPTSVLLAGESFRYDGAAGLVALRLDAADPRLLHVETLDEVVGVPARCQRRTVVRVAVEDAERVVLEASEYRRRDRGPEEQCPFPAYEPSLAAVTLARPLGDRDVHANAAGRTPLFVQDRTAPGRTPVPGTPSCADSSAAQPDSGDYINYIRHAGRSYVNRGLQVVPGTRFGTRLGTVTCRVAESLTPAGRYRLTNGHAAYLDKGTPYYAVVGIPAHRAIGATFNGQRLVFTLDATLQ